MNKAILILVLIIAVVFLAPFVIMAVWYWVIPDVFSGAVEHGLLPAALTYWQAWKMVILLAVLGLTGKGNKK